MKVLVGIAKVVTGVMIAMATLFFAGVATTRYVMWRMAELPPRPTFPNDNPTRPKPLPPANAATPTATAPVAAQPTPTAQATPTPTPTPGGAQARVTQQIGLIVRDAPSRDSSRVGGVAFNQTVTILETSPDGEWVRVRVNEGGVEGWVRAGNTEPLNQ